MPAIVFNISNKTNLERNLNKKTQSEFNFVFCIVFCDNLIILHDCNSLGTPHSEWSNTTAKWLLSALMRVFALKLSNVRQCEILHGVWIEICNTVQLLTTTAKFIWWYVDFIAVLRVS